MLRALEQATQGDCVDGGWAPSEEGDWASSRTRACEVEAELGDTSWQGAGACIIATRRDSRGEEGGEGWRPGVPGREHERPDGVRGDMDELELQRLEQSEAMGIP